MFFATIFTEQAKATNSSYAWGALEFYQSPYWEYYDETSLCADVTSMMPGSWNAINNYESNTNSANLFNAISYTESNDIRTATLWVGDFCPLPYPPNSENYHIHWTFYSGGTARNQGDHSWDSMIYYYTGPNNSQWFQFIWTCSCGGIYFYWDENWPYWPLTSYPSGYYNTNTEYGFIDPWYGGGLIGMPYAWTGNPYMSLDGYNSGYGQNCYIGWENTSPYILDQCHDSSTSYNNFYFVFFFYQYAMGQIDSNFHNIHDSLDYAASQIYGQYTTFDECPYSTGWEITTGLWSRLNVLGNANLSP